MLVLGYFSQIVLEDAQDLISGNEIHRMISLGGHCIESEKRRVSRLKMVDLVFLYFLFSFYFP